MKGRPNGVKSKRFHRWTLEQEEYVKSIYKGKTTVEVAELVNEKFGLTLIGTQIETFKKKRGLKSNVDTTFKKGSTPPNKGTEGLTSSNKTSFKKGNIPKNTKPIGSERLHTKDDLLLIKVSDNPHKWEYKHRYIYKQHHGEIKKGNVITFLDGNNRNFNIDNLASITKRQSLVLNRYKLRNNDADLTKVGINIANIMIKISELEGDKN